MTKRIKICPVCGVEFELVGNKSNRRIYCSKKCSRQHELESRQNRRFSRTSSGRTTDYPIRYNPKKAQAAHDRQAEIERKARAAGMSYGKYQMMKYMERMEG